MGLNKRVYDYTTEQGTVDLDLYFHVDKSGLVKAKKMKLSTFYHSHANKSILDNTEQSFTSTLKTAYDSAYSASHSHSNKANIDTINQNLASSDTPAFTGMTLGLIKPPIGDGMVSLKNIANNVTSFEFDCQNQNYTIKQSGSDATSTATQRNSGILILQTSTWNGSYEEKLDYEIYAYVDQSINQKTQLILKAYGTKFADIGPYGFGLWDGDELNKYFYCDSVNLKIGINTINPVTKLTVVDTASTSPRGIMSFQTSTDTSGARFHLRKTRGTQESPVVIASGDMLGRLVSSGYIGPVNTYKESASIDFISTGTINDTGTGRLGSYIVFNTMPDSNSAGMTEALRINSDQTVSFSKWKPLSDSTTALQFFKNNGSSLVFDIDTSNSRIGLGVVPITKLHVSAGTAQTAVAIKLSIPTTTGEGISQGYDFALDEYANARLWNYSSTSLSFGTNNLERLKIAANGDVSLNSMAPASSALVESSAGGVISASKILIEAYITDATSKANLENTGNWSGKSYTGATVTSYQGQKHYDADYEYECVADNVWKRKSWV
jgi:hypothetical protein